jgi:hypothetical protein
MKWRKLGLIFRPDHHHDWMVSHAANPVAEHLDGDRFRMYFSCRDRAKRSNVGFVEIDLRNPRRILRLSEEPVLRPGAIGSYDDSGISLGCLVTLESGDRRLYYMGWNLCRTVPWRNSIGLACSESSGLSFRQCAPAPILDRSAVDPFSLSYPWVLRQGERWRMWYGSNTAWGASTTDSMHVLKHAESADGVHFTRDGRAVLDLSRPDEYALTRPCVLVDGGRYRMWFSHRGEAYRIGYAESDDGICWQRRDDEVGIAPSSSDWDSDMIEYPCVFDHEGDRYLLYNGNDYGGSGFGLAVLEAD